jgi:hypothetical protein
MIMFISFYLVVAGACGYGKPFEQGYGLETISLSTTLFDIKTKVIRFVACLTAYKLELFFVTRRLLAVSLEGYSIVISDKSKIT